MADIYVRNTGANSSPFATWGNAATTLAGALAVATSADTIWVADDHAESQATAITLTLPSTVGLKILGVNTHATTPPTAANLVAAGAWTASLTTTGNVAINIAGGFAYIYGLQFITGSGQGGSSAQLNIGSTAGAQGIVVDNCFLRIAETGAAVCNIMPVVGATCRDCLVIVKNSTFRFGGTGQAIGIRQGRARISNCLIDSAGSAPTTLFTAIQASGGDVEVSNCDLTGKTWTNLVNAGNGTPLILRFRDCKFPASFVATTGSVPGPGGAVVELYNCDSGNTNYRLSRNTYMGSTNNNNSIYRTGGASDGTTPESFQMVSNSGASNYYVPLGSPEIFAYNGQTGVSLTAVVDFIHDSATALTDADIWLDIIYLSDTGSPLGSSISNAAATVLTAGSNHASSSSAWTGTGGFANANAQKLSVTFTPQQKGYMIARVMLAKANYTVYVDPYLQGVGGTNRQLLLPYYGFMNIPASTSSHGSA